METVKDVYEIHIVIPFEIQVPGFTEQINTAVRSQ